MLKMFNVQNVRKKKDSETLFIMNHEVHCRPVVPDMGCNLNTLGENLESHWWKQKVFPH